MEVVLFFNFLFIVHICSYISVWIQPCNWLRVRRHWTVLSACAWLTVGHAISFHPSGFLDGKRMHTNRGREITTITSFSCSHVWLSAQILLNFFIFGGNFLTSWSSIYKFTEVFDEVFVDEYSHFDPDIADSLSNSSKQLGETSHQDGVKMQIVFTLTLMLQITTFSTVVTP